MGVGDVFHFYEYKSDNTNNYALKLSEHVAAAGGFSTVVDPLVIPPWPFHERNVRHVLGDDGAGHSTRLPVQSNTTSLYVSGGSFTIGARTYSSGGAIGEKRKLNSIG